MFDFNQFRKTVEKFVNRRCDIKSYAPTEVYIHRVPSDDGATNLQVDLMNMETMTSRAVEIKNVDSSEWSVMGILVSVQEGLDELHGMYIPDYRPMYTSLVKEHKKIEETVKDLKKTCEYLTDKLKSNKGKTHLVEINLAPPSNFSSDVSAPPYTIVAKYSFNGETFSFTKGELSKVTVDSRALNQFVLEMVHRAMDNGK